MWEARWSQHGWREASEGKVTGLGPHRVLKAILSSEAFTSDEVGAPGGLRSGRGRPAFPIWRTAVVLWESRLGVPWQRR